MKSKANSLAKTVRVYLQTKPYLAYALEKEVVNYSALAQKIKADVEEKLGRKVSMEAIAVSAKRYAENLVKEASVQEAQLLKLLSKSQVNMKNNIVDITFKKGDLGGIKEFKPIMVSSGSSAETLVINNEDLGKVNVVNAIEIRKNLVEISIISPKNVESVPGFVDYVTGLLSANGINIVEFLSCYTDTIFILEKDDALKAYEILSEKCC
ncbi:MAG: ACT domain-containing protein [archaeon]